MESRMVSSVRRIWSFAWLKRIRLTTRPGPHIPSQLGLGVPLCLESTNLAVAVRMTPLTQWVLWGHVAMLTVVLVAVPANDWRLTRTSAYFMLAAYAGTLTGNLVFMG